MSEIDTSVPPYGDPTTAAVRANFQIAANEIDAATALAASKLSDAPSDGSLYARMNGVWTVVPPASTTPPLMNGAAAIGTGNAWARSDHVHPSDTSRLPLTGGTLTGPLIVAADPAVALGVATKQYVDRVSGIGEAPTDGALYGRSNAAWSRALPIIGGTLTGPLTLNANAAAALQPVTLQQLQTRPTINQPHIMGVTDGSNAAAGEIGEYLTYNSNWFGMSGTSGSGIPAFTLPAGDWDLWGFCGTQPSAGTTLAWFFAAFSIGATQYPGATHVINASIATSYAIPLARTVLTVATPVTVAWSTGFAAGSSCQALLSVSARRVR